MLALINGKILTMEGQNHEQGTILIKDGKISEFGDKVEIPKGYKVIDLKGQTVMPGIVDAHTHLGICEEIYLNEGDDVNEMSEPVTPQLRALDAINFFDLGFSDALKGGVTSAMVAPGSANVVGGMTCVMKMAGENLDERVIKQEAGMKVAFGENPKDTYGSEKKMPYTRMAIAAMLRECLVDTENYKNDEESEKDLAKEAMLLVLDKQVPLRAHAHRADDILTALRIKREFDINMVIEHATEGHLIVNELKKENIPVCVGPLLVNRAKVEMKEKTFKAPGILQEAGVKVALITDHPETPIEYAILNGALAVKEGMDYHEALKALTINPAEIMGLDDRIGSIKVGKDADLAVWTGDPLDIRNKVSLTIIDGKIVYKDEA